MIVMPRIYDHGEEWVDLHVRFAGEEKDRIIPLTVNEAAGLIVDLAEILARRARVPLNKRFDRP